MSGDEVLVLIAAGGLSVFFWGAWIRDVMLVYDRRGTYVGIFPVFVPFVSLLMLFVILKQFSSFDVRDSVVYLVFYMVVGLAWCGLMSKGASFLGLDFRHDVAEQDNVAADVAISGVVLGSMLCYAGGNIGNGPGWWVVIFCAALATGAMVLIWIVLDQVNGVCEAITVDRDLATGIRFAGIMIAAGLVLGRSVAGDWISWDATFWDFVRMAAPVLCVVGVALFVDFRTRLSKEVPAQDPVAAGAVPALLYIGAAVFYVLHLGAF